MKPRRLTRWAVSALLLGLSYASAASPSHAETHPVEPSAAKADQLAAEVIALANVERAHQGLPLLRGNALLGEVAERYASVLANGACFAHTCGDLPDLRQRVEVVRYNWRGLGENIAAGQRSPLEAVTDWLESPNHRANLLNPTFEEIGVGVVSGAGEFGTYWVMVIGKAAGDQ